jgi:hypothetical protein
MVTGQSRVRANVVEERRLIVEDARGGSSVARVRSTTPNVKNHTFRNVAKTYRQPKAKCNIFLQREMLAFSAESSSLQKRSFSQNADRAMALYSLRSQRFHRLCLPCAYRRPEGSHQQGRQQDQQGCKVKPQIIRLHPVQLTA